MASLSELKVLYAENQLIISRLKETETFLLTHSPGTDINQIKNRLAALANIKEECISNLVKIISLEDDYEIDSITDVSEMVVFETR